MPVSGNEEPGVLAWQSSKSLSHIPIKKRWLSMVVQPCSLIHEPRSFSNENLSKTKDSSLGKGSVLNSCDNIGKSDTPKNSLLEVNEERPWGAKVDSQPTMLPFLSMSQETNRDTSFEPSRNVDNLVKPALAEKLAAQEDKGRTKVSVEKEVIAKQGKSQCKLELPSNSRHVELSLGPQEPHVSSLVDLNTEGKMCGTVNPSLLSPSLNKWKDMSQEGRGKDGLNNNDADDIVRTDRSNWDLNTPMDSWEGSGDVVPVQDASEIDLLHKTSSSVDRKPPISSASIVDPNGDKGKQEVGASEQEFSFPISSTLPALQYKSADVFHLNLGSTFLGFDSSVLQSLTKVDSRVGPNSSLPKNLAMNRNMNNLTCKTVKSESVEEIVVQANAGTAVCPAGTLEANVGKIEVVGLNLRSIELSTKGPEKLLERKPTKHEPFQEVSQEISMTSDVIVHQSVGKVLQLQESSSSPCSSSSSSTLPMPLTPQQGCPSRLSSCSDLSVSAGDLSAPSEYSVHTNEANRSKNLLNQANADTAAKIANSDLKESNVSSDKVGTSVSEAMNIEGHILLEKTQDPHNLVASGEGSANNGEKVSISASTEEECYGSDYESDGHHAFEGHVDSESVGCVREDEDYEDGEVREPMMQSIAGDAIAEGKNSEKNNESSSKNAGFSSGFSGVGESHGFTNDEKGYSKPVHTESNDDFVKGCDVKAVKIDHKDGNLRSPLLDEVETTGDDEQRPIGAIHQGSVDQSGITDVQERCERDVLCDGAYGGSSGAGSSGAGRNVDKANNENIGRSDMSPTAVSSLKNTETSVNANSSEYLSNVGSKSRIIRLPRTSDVTFSSNIRPLMGRSLSSRSRREMYSDVDEEKFHLRRNRDEIYADGPKFVQDRFQDHSFDSSRGKIVRGRGRSSGRFNSSHSDWDSVRDSESYGDVADYRLRRKRTVAVEESENECNDYNSGRLDGAAFASDKRRKPLNDALPSFRHPPARRLSPHGRENASMMGTQMLRRAPRSISPSRCTDEDVSDYVGLRHSEKFNRDFPADISDPVYTHQQSMYDGPDGHFVQGKIKFTAMQGRGFPRMRSKSPVKSCSWSSPRKKLTEGFNGHQDSSQHRSPVMYKEDRVRTSPRTSLTEEAIAPQRRDSPSYTARRLNYMRDVDALQEQRHPRSLSSRSRPPNWVFTRSNRRVENLDHRERADDDEYFDGTIHTGRFPELDERRKYSERRGGPRRIRNVEEQDGNFRQSEQLWHEEEFDDSRLKRRRLLT
ncbi:putative macrophage erythroblast attacher-like [Capsicum annuum]|uniref:uncharacterized protein LOC107870271 isoform X1 n=1 Tax=Capsicum annuum TaxID=4072 RepID=UPI0007BEF39F|nr:uncharacterized protein LOC107870271 isoform X1 [Capsicum annuum]KAF3673087.1 putative macrophage erythroblast attacher-like [Capsicum annuum]